MPDKEEEPVAVPPGFSRTAAAFQVDEITEHHIYRSLAAVEKNAHNKEILERMAGEELGHYRVWKQYTGRDVGPDRVRAWAYSMLARVLGITFALKLMEKKEKGAVSLYRSLGGTVPEAAEVIAQEEHHEIEVLALLDEERLRYAGSIVLGLNDALVEFTGSLAGFTFALQDTRIIAAVGFITGIAASLSMASSEYLSQKSDRTREDPLRAAFYTGIAYIITVILLVSPFLLVPQPFAALMVTLGAALAVIVFFTYYTSVAGDLPFLKRCAEMAVLSLGIAGISFLIGLAVRVAFQVSV